jgi:Predicted phosphatase/phosphohexomutase
MILITIGHNKIIKNFNNNTVFYLHCLKKLKLSNFDCLAIEDTEISFKYAKKAKLRCVAFPGDYHRSGKYKDSFIKVKRLNSKIFADL